MGSYRELQGYWAEICYDRVVELWRGIDARAISLGPRLNVVRFSDKSIPEAGNCGVAAGLVRV